jgi:hypothetical protein
MRGTEEGRSELFSYVRQEQHHRRPSPFIASRAFTVMFTKEVSERTRIGFARAVWSKCPPDRKQLTTKRLQHAVAHG